ncbi:hypothetical protein K8I28_07950 [bacterium]|nr:hypothetical protein [bacterium]
MRYLIILLLLFIGCSEDSEPVRATSVIEITVPEELVNTRWSSNFGEEMIFSETEFIITTENEYCLMSESIYLCEEVSDTSFTLKIESNKHRANCVNDFEYSEIGDSAPSIQYYKYTEPDSTELDFWHIPNIVIHLTRIPWN